MIRASLGMARPSFRREHLISHLRVTASPQGEAFWRLRACGRDQGFPMPWTFGRHTLVFFLACLSIGGSLLEPSRPTFNHRGASDHPGAGGLPQPTSGGGIGVCLPFRGRCRQRRRMRQARAIKVAYLILLRPGRSPSLPHPALARHLPLKGKARRKGGQGSF